MWGSSYPTAEDDVLIPYGYTITAGYGSTCRNLTVEGMLQSRWAAPSLVNVYGDMSVGFTGQTQPQLGGHIIYNLHGDLSVDGYYMVDITYFWGDGSDNMYVTVSQGPAATLFSSFTQNEPTIELRLLTDLSLGSGAAKSEFYNGEFDLNGHKLSNVNLHYGYLKGNNYDWTCGIGNCQLNSTHLVGWISTSDLVEIMDNFCDAIGTIQNNGFLTGGWTLTVAWNVQNLINNGTFYIQPGSSFAAYLSDYLINNGTYQVPTYFNGGATELSPQVIVNNPGAVLQAPLSSIGTWIYSLSDLDLHGYTWDVGNLIVGSNLISNGTLSNGCIHSLDGAIVHIGDCLLLGITVSGNLITSGSITICDDNVHFNGNVTVNQQLSNSDVSVSQLDINGTLDVGPAAAVTVIPGAEFYVRLSGNLNSSGYINLNQLIFDGSGSEHQTLQINPGAQNYFNISCPGSSGVHLTSDLAMNGYSFSTGSMFVDARLTISGCHFSGCVINEGPVYLQDCDFTDMSLDAPVTIQSFGTIMDSNVMFNNTLTIPELSALVGAENQSVSLMATGNSDNAGVIAHGNNGTMVANCARGIVNTGIWNVPTILFGAWLRTIDASNLGPSLQVETGSHVNLVGINHLPGFTIQANATLRITPGAELTMNDDEFFVGTLINEGVFRNTRTNFSGVNQYFEATVDFNDATPSVSRQTLEHHSIPAPGLDFSINRWWKVITAFDDRPPSLGATLTLCYHDTELNGNTEAGLGVYYSSDQGSTWVKLSTAQAVQDMQNNTFTIASAPLNGLYTLSSLFYNWDPESLQIGLAHTGLVRLEWLPTDGAASYDVYRSTYPNGVFQLYGSTSQISYTDTNPQPRAFYKIIARTQTP